MKNTDISIYYATNLQDALYTCRTVKNLSVTAGCTGILYSKNKVYLTNPESILDVQNVEECTHIKKDERYIEYGSSVTLSQIIDNDATWQPKVLRESAKTVANIAVRNRATIGGNICMQPMRMTLFAPLLALNAELEFRVPRKKELNSKKRFFKKQKHEFSDTERVKLSSDTKIESGCFLTKIRIPLEEWDISFFRRLGPHNTISPLSASFVFLAKTQKNVLSSIRIAFCGAFPFSFRAQSFENSLIGYHLPLSPKVIQNATEQALSLFDETMADAKTLPPILRQQFCNLLEESLAMLAE